MHQTVFRQAAVEWLQVQPERWYLDATLGAGGHTSEILARGGRVVALDYDDWTLKRGQERFASEVASGQLILINRNFAYLSDIIKLLPTGSPRQFAGMIFDLGTSSDQLTSGRHGLSVYENGPLDMRLDKTMAVTAQDLLLGMSERELIRLFDEYGGETESRRIAREIIKVRAAHPGAFSQSFELANLVSRVKKNNPGRLHPATKVFQALRIAVNDELGNLERALPQAQAALQPGGRLVVIAFHEGEDRPVKRAFRAWTATGQGRILTARPQVPEGEELENPRARSAKMRVWEKAAEGSLS